MTVQSASASGRPGQSGPPAPGRETRFAVVLNGGVSLAVWMGGVTHELNRLRLASARDVPETPGDPRPTDPKEAAVHDAWCAILRAASRRAVVDTVAGTSAGGLNGTLLATAVAWGKDLPDMRRTWSEVAALERGKLLSETGEPPNAVLDGDFFHDEVLKLIDGIHGGGQIVAPQDCALLVTATALDADPVPIQLEDGAQAHMVDSRRVYRFERRTLTTGEAVGGLGDPPDGAAGPRTSIALAARASASFPVAFAPVLETEQLRGFRTSPPPGPTDAATQEAAPSDEWLIDGGVLDNAPFGPLLDVLRNRSVGAPFERVVLYITPSPGIAGRARELGSPPRATRTLGRVLAALREPDLRSDYERLRHEFAVMGYTLSTPHSALLQLLRADDPEQLISTVPQLVLDAEWFTTYRASRAEAVERQLLSLPGGVSFARPGPPADPPPEPLLAVPTSPAYDGETWQWGLATATRALRWWGRALVAYHGEAGDDQAAVAGALAMVQPSQDALRQLHDDLQTHLRNLPAESTLQARINELNGELRGMESQIREAVEAAADAIVGLPQLTGISRNELIDFTLAVEVASTVFSWSSSSEGDEPVFRYRQITPEETSLVELGEDVTGRPEWPARKLYGERLGHFGAFLKRGDREADWLWGRLDGAGALSEYFLSGVAADEAAPLRHKLALAILAAENSSVPALRRATERAVGTSSLALLRDLEPGALSGGARFLWDKAGALVRHRLRPQADAEAPGTTTGLPAPQVGSAAPGSI